MSLSEWLSVLADVASLAAFCAIYVVGRTMHKHHVNDKRHLPNGDE